MDEMIDLRRLAGVQANRVYAVGDIHGRLDLLLHMERLIAEDIAKSPPGGAALVCYLGDFVDRGPDSAGVVDHLARAAERPWRQAFLKGNHEDRMLAFLEDPAANGPRWMQFGGPEALESYGLSTAEIEAEHWAAIRDRLTSALPEHHLEFLRGLELAVRWGDYLFVHAGLDPAHGLESQSVHDLMWMREPFLSSEKDWGVRVVHGHVIEPEPVFRANRIGLDTGAYRSGVLTCGVFEGDEVRVLQTR